MWLARKCLAQVGAGEWGEEGEEEDSTGEEEEEWQGEGGEGAGRYLGARRW